MSSFICNNAVFFECNFVGGFAFVYVVQDVDNGTEYALKRLLGSDKQACNNIIRELNFHKQLSGHPNIVKYVAASFIDHTNSAKGNAEYLLVSELCKAGSLIDCMGSSIEPDTVLKIVYQITKAVAHMHSQNPPITHRDIKVIFQPMPISRIFLINLFTVFVGGKFPTNYRRRIEIV